MTALQVGGECAQRLEGSRARAKNSEKATYLSARPVLLRCAVLVYIFFLYSRHVVFCQALRDLSSNRGFLEYDVDEPKETRRVCCVRPRGREISTASAYSLLGILEDLQVPFHL
jgi:hypothetical protein